MRLSDSCRQEAEGGVGSEHGSRQVCVVIILAKQGRRKDKAKISKTDTLDALDDTITTILTTNHDNQS